MGPPARWGVAAVVLALGAAPGPLEADGGKKKPAAAPRPALAPGCVRVVEGFNGTLSADGKRLAFTRKAADDSSEVWVRDLKGKKEWKLPHDSTPKAWTTTGTLLLRAGYGVEPLKGARDPAVAALPSGADAWALAWTRDGKRLAYAPRTKGIETTRVHWVDAGGTTGTPTDTAGLRTDQAAWLAWSPDGTRLFVNALFREGGDDERRIGVLDVADDEMKVIAEMPADSEIPGLHGGPRWSQLVDGVARDLSDLPWKRPGGPRYGADVWDGAGALVTWVEGEGWTEADAFVADPRGTEIWRVTVDGAAKWSPALDPAGRRLAFLTAEGMGKGGTYRNPRIRVIDLRKGDTVDLPVPAEGRVAGLEWAEDGRQVLYEVRGEINASVYLQTVAPPGPAPEGAPIRRLELGPTERVLGWLASAEAGDVRAAAERAEEDWDSAYVPALREALKAWASRDEDVGLVTRLVRLVVTRGVREAIPELRAALSSDRLGVPRSAARALWRLEAKEAIPDLDRVRTATKNSDTRLAAAAAMAGLGDDRGWDDLAAAAKRTSREARMDLCASLARIRHPRSVDLLIPLVSDTTYLEWLSVGQRKKVGDAAQLALEGLTGQSLGADPAAWSAWWEGEAKRTLPESAPEPGDLRMLLEFWDQS